MMNRLKLPERWTRYLLTLPESGMGYQRVSVRLKDGRTLKPAVVLNAELLEIPQGESVAADDILDITLDR